MISLLIIKVEYNIYFYSKQQCNQKLCFKSYQTQLWFEPQYTIVLRNIPQATYYSHKSVENK